MKAAVALLGLFFYCFSALGADLRPTPRPQADRLRLAEATWSCHVGYGLQQDTLLIEGRFFGAHGPSNPTHSFTKPGYLGFGCITPWLYTNYSFLDRSLELPGQITLSGQTYDQVSYRLDQLGIGASFPMIPHRLYLDFGLQPYILSYSLGYYPEDLAGVVRSDVFKQNGSLIQTRLRYYMNAFFFGSYEFSKNLDSKGMVQSSAKFGLNMRVRY